MWLLIVLMLGFPTTGGSFYTVVGSYPNRDACLRAQVHYNQTTGLHHIKVRTACTAFNLP